MYTGKNYDVHCFHLTWQSVVNLIILNLFDLHLQVTVSVKDLELLMAHVLAGMIRTKKVGV